VYDNYVEVLEIGSVEALQAYARNLSERIIRQQQEAIRELSTPVLQMREQLLILPIIGVLDDQRARQLTEQLLLAIRANRAKVVVIDFTGVPTIDSTVANHLVQTVDASGLMGASVIITGLSSEIALTLVTIGLELSKMNAVGDLQGGIEEAERLLGYEVSRTSDRARNAR
jgi:rsbT co-antagonist protein RsbR